MLPAGRRTRTGTAPAMHDVNGEESTCCAAGKERQVAEGGRVVGSHAMACPLPPATPHVLKLGIW